MPSYSPRALCSLYVIFCKSQGYSWANITLHQSGGPSPHIYIPQGQNGPVQSHVTTDGQSISMAWCLVHSAIEGLHPQEFQSGIRRGTLRRNVWSYHWEGCMWSMQSNVEFGYRLSICSGTQGKPWKPWSSWLVAGPSRCKLTPSQQSGIKYVSSNTSPYLCFPPPLFHMGLEGLHPSKCQSNIRRGTFRRNFLCYHWEGCMGSMQNNVEFGYHLSISGTKKNRGKTWSSCPVAGPSRCKLTSSQQSGIKYRALTLVPICAVFLSSLKTFTICFYKNCICI
jgi:hypothetical protein